MYQVISPQLWAQLWVFPLSGASHWLRDEVKAHRLTRSEGQRASTFWEFDVVYKFAMFFWAFLRTSRTGNRIVHIEACGRSSPVSPARIGGALVRMHGFGPRGPRSGSQDSTFLVRLSTDTPAVGLVTACPYP